MGAGARGKALAILAAAAFLCAVALSCVSGAASAEEYYNLGMAYFDLGKYDEAAKWLDRARGADRTRHASEYTLGRIAFARNNYEAALGHFEKILKKDPKNIPALKAAAYTLIRLERLEGAERYYGRLMELSPESADNGYSYGVVLFALKKPAEAEAVLDRYAAPLADNRDALLLLARVRRAQGKVEAIDDYHAWLAGGDDLQVRREYAEALEQGEFYARALEEYRRLFQNAAGAAGGLSLPELHFAIARVLLIADSEGGGLEELEGALEEGFSDTLAVEALLDHPAIPEARKGEIRRILREEAPGAMQEE